MNFIANMSNKVKIVILVGYSFLVLAIALLIITNSFKNKSFKQYTDECADEHITLNLRMLETRKSPFENNTDYEKAEYDFYLFITKKDENAIISSVGIYITTVNKDGKRVYNEYVSTSQNMGSSTYTYQISGSRINVANTITKTITKTNDELTKKDLEPKRVYARLVYTIAHNNVTTQNLEIKYSANISDITKIDFDSFEKREINYANYIENKEEVLDFKITQDETTSTSPKDTPDKQNYYAVISTNNGYLENQKIKNASVEIIGKISDDSTVSTDPYFSKYVRLFNYYGMINSHTIPSLTQNLDKKYAIEKLYVIAHIELENGKTKTIEFQVETNILPLK